MNPDLQKSKVTGITDVTDLNIIEISGYTDKLTAGNRSNLDKITGEPETSGAIPLDARPVFMTYTEPTSPYKRSGLWYHGIDTKGQEPKPVDTWICTPIFAGAQTHGQDGSNHGLLLRFMASSGKWSTWAAPMHLLAGSGEELRRELLDRGLRMDLNSRPLLSRWIMQCYPPEHLTAVASTGWYENSFVLPSRVIGNAKATFQNEGATDHYESAGSIRGWRDEIGRYLPGNPLLILAVSAALAGPLLHLTGRQGGGLHLVGDSSTGKSTALLVSASIWGGPSFIRTWRATGNGLEGAASEVNDTALILDEIGQADPRDIGTIVYAIGNGTGKARANRSGLARRVTRWRVMLLSSGERTLGAHMAEDRGRTPKAGQLVRLLDIPVKRLHGLYDALHDFSGGAALSDYLKQATQRNYGKIGIAFLERLVEEAPKLDLPGKLDTVLQTQDFQAQEGLHQRAAATLALCGMAGELAKEWGLLPIREGEAMQAAALGFRLWAQEQGQTRTEDRQVLQAVQDFLDRHGGSRFEPLDSEESVLIRDRAGWIRPDGVYLFTSGGLREAAAGHDLSRALDALEAAGWIIDHDPGKKSKVTKIEGRPIRLYWVRQKEDQASLANGIASMRPAAVTPVTRGNAGEVTDQAYSKQSGYPSYFRYPATHQSDHDAADRSAIQWESEQSLDPEPTGTADVPGFEGIPELTPAQHGVIRAQLRHR